MPRAQSTAGGGFGQYESRQHSANPQPGVAHRWISQARHDLDAVNCDQLSDNYEWACYKCHQV